MHIPDFPFDNSREESFVHHSVVLQYLLDYAKHFNLFSSIKVSKSNKHLILIYLLIIDVHTCCKKIIMECNIEHNSLTKNNFLLRKFFLTKNELSSLHTSRI